MMEAEIDTVIAKALADAPLIFNSQELAAFIRMRLRAHGMEVVSVEPRLMKPSNKPEGNAQAPFSLVTP